ncbi:MAG: PAS domain S-box protein [Magnetococcales bacterium]|nr:PAS domain S-box protein [Magnetococcales bacterium]
MFNNAIYANITTDKKGKILDFNLTTQQLFGYSVAQAVGRKVVELIIPPIYKKIYNL